MDLTPHGIYQQPPPGDGLRFFQVGIIVDDLVEAAHRWIRVHGVGPFLITRSATLTGELDGVPYSTDVQVAVAQAGPAQIELIHHVSDGPTPFDGFIGKRAQFHQLCTVTTDYDARRAHLESLGHRLLHEIVIRDGSRVAFFDTFDDFGFVTEVVEETERFLAGVASIAQTCANWDGTDPIRYASRDGYRTTP